MYSVIDWLSRTLGSRLLASEEGSFERLQPAAMARNHGSERGFEVWGCKVLL